jgi:O-glycosyl hydrolase
LTIVLLSCVASGAVTVQIDGSDTHQVMEGFGATTLSLAYAAKDNVRADLRPKALQAVYRDVGLNMGNLELEPFESPPSNVFAPANDDADPSSFNANGFNWVQSDNLVDKIVTPAKQYGFDNYYLGPVVNTGYALSWVNALRSSDYQRFLDEIAEHVLAAVTHWRDAYSITPRYLQLWNEPLSGNGELSGGSPQELVDIVKRTGARLTAAGFTPRFVVPAEETESISLSHASLILADAAARPFVGAIAYHPYPYGSTYASVPNILSSSGSGKPSATAIAARNSLRDLGAQYGIPVFMVEVSHSDLSFDDFDGVRGRAIQIHDELEYADASAFFGMNAMWDSTSHAEHYAGRADPGFYSETDTIALVNNDTGAISISPMGHAIGHYARWIRRGAVRVGATSSDPLLQISAFADRARARTVVVAINNATTSLTVDVSFTGLSVSGSATGEQSTASAVWAKLPDRSIVPSAPFEFSAPARSVTTWSFPLLGALTDAGAPNDDAGSRGGMPGAAGGAPSIGGAAGGGGAAPSTGGAAGGSGRGGAGNTIPSGGTAGNAGVQTDGESDSGTRPDSGARSPTKTSQGGGCNCHTASRQSGPSPGPTVAVVLLGMLLGRLSSRRRSFLQDRLLAGSTLMPTTKS